MDKEWIVPAALGALALLVLVLAVALLRARAAARRERVAGRAETAALRAQVEEVERRLAAAAASGERRARPPAEPEFVITDAGEAPAVAPGLFADLVLRESVVRAASLVHGVRVALAPETRNRIRFEVRREVRRSRKQRRTDTRLARREQAARQRAALPDDHDPDTEDAA